MLSGNVDFPYGALADPSVGGSGGLIPPPPFTLGHDFFVQDAITNVCLFIGDFPIYNLNSIII